MKKDPKINKHFVGVFALDEFKYFVKSNGFRADGISVCNGQNAKQPGDHWFLYLLKTIIFCF